MCRWEVREARGEGEANGRQGELPATAGVSDSTGVAAERTGVHLFQTMCLLCYINQQTQEALSVVGGRVCGEVPRSVGALHQLNTYEQSARRLPRMTSSRCPRSLQVVLPKVLTEDQKER